MKLRNVVTDNGDLFGYEFYCPACKQRQTIPTEAIAGAIVWSFNHDMLHPTFRPSLRTHWGSEGLTFCHACITDGRIEFLADSTHALSGQTVELPELEEA